jgi:hypothetical protein
MPHHQEPFMRQFFSSRSIILAQIFARHVFVQL